MPPLFNPTRYISQSRRSPALAAAFFHTVRARAQTSRPERYGTAKQPPPHLAEEKAKDGANVEPSENKPEVKQDIVPGIEPAKPKSEFVKALPPPKPSDSPVSFPAKDNATKDQSNQPNSLDRVLDVSSPNEPDDGKPPHLQAPKYVHHFDTWGLVKDLQQGGFTQDQSVSIMKAVRGMLADNMDLARKALVSKSNVENETYLFKAACSELKTEIQNNRQTEADKWRSQRTQQQHEVDVLGQTLTQGSSNLKDELRGLFEDRKMAYRMEQKHMDSKIQDVNYRITVDLNSEARSEVEGVRWLLTRRAGSALIIVVVMVLATLNYSRYMIALQEAERKKHEQDVAATEQILNSVQKASTHGLAEEAILAPEGVTGG